MAQPPASDVRRRRRPGACRGSVAERQQLLDADSSKTRCTAAGPRSSEKRSLPDKSMMIADASVASTPASSRCTPSMVARSSSPTRPIVWVCASRRELIFSSPTSIKSCARDTSRPLSLTKSAPAARVLSDLRPSALRPDRLMFTCRRVPQATHRREGRSHAPAVFARLYSRPLVAPRARSAAGSNLSSTVEGVEDEIGDGADGYARGPDAIPIRGAAISSLMTNSAKP